MTAGPRSVVAFGLLCAALSVTAWGAQGVQSDPVSQERQLPSIRQTRPEIARRGQYPREEWFVRDVYARLMRYDHAARQIAAAERIEQIAPDAYLVVAVGPLRTREVGAGGSDPDAGKPGSGPVVTLERRALCHLADPCHASYDAAWAERAAVAGSPRVFAGAVTRATAYEVTVTLAGETRTYAAEVRYHQAVDGSSVEAEVLDPVIPGLQQLADDDAPLAVASWEAYVRTRRYAAVVDRVRTLRRPGRRSVPDRAPIGYLPGDDVTPWDEQQLMMAGGVPCAPVSLTVWADQQQLRPEGTGSPSATTVYVMTNPLTPGLEVTLTLAGERDSGGHMDDAHVGQRPAGSLSATARTTDGSGGFYVSYAAPVIGEVVTVTARAGAAEATVRFDIQVQGLVELGPGTNYRLVGWDCAECTCSAHPQGTNHWGTAGANSALVAIADDYRGGYPTASRLRYNDQSLPRGGKFDLACGWSNVGSHDEHRLGVSADVTMSTVPAENRPELLIIFERHVASFVPEPTRNHWHLRFE
jgi:hypothetical protein